MTRLLGLFLIVSAIVLTACNGISDPEIPPERPLSDISGYVVDEAIVGASIAVYAFDDGKPGELLASAVSTDTEGAYTLQLQSKDRPILIEARGGSYTDLVSGTRIDIDSDQVLRAVTVYRSGEPLTLMVTPLTHIAAGLAEHKVANGMTANDAVTKANADISELFQLDIANTRPFSINDPSAADRDGQFYGFYLAAMSSWANWVAERGNATPGAAFSAIELAQIIYNDIYADGVLDGVGANSSGQPMTLAFANQPLSSSVYRRDFARHMITLAASDKNVSGVTIDALLPRAQALQDDDNGLVPVAHDGGGPTLNSSLTEGKFYNGPLEFMVTPSEAVVLKQVQFYVDGGQPLGNASDLNKPAIIIDTTKYKNGEHNLTAKATDFLGNSFESTFVVKFDNLSPRINVLPKFLTKNSPFLLSGTYIQNAAGVAKILVNNQEATFKSGGWSMSVQLKEGLNPFNLTIIDAAGNQTTAQTVVALDQTQPVFVAAIHGMARLSDGGDVPIERLLEDTEQVAVLLETNNVDLKVAPASISRQLLANTPNAPIPFFAFTVNDPVKSSVGTAFDKLKVSLQVEKIAPGQQVGQSMTGWMPLVAVNNEYLLPLVTERLYTDWLKSTSDDVIVLRVKVVDEALNESEKLFTFRPNFIVPSITIPEADVVDVNWVLAGNVGNDFGRRGELNGQSFAAVKYSFQNSTGHDFYIRLDSGVATVTRNVSQIQWKDKVKKTTSEHWRAQFYDLSSYSCTQDPPELREDFAMIYNYKDGQWQSEVRPAPVEEDIFIEHDSVIPLDEIGEWVVQTDNEVFVDSRLDGSIVEYDYSENVNNMSAAWVKYFQPPDSDPLQGCNGASLFAKKIDITYSQVPVRVSEEIVRNPEITPFAADNFEVTDDNTGQPILPVPGSWYLIPAGDKVTITRIVNTPFLTVAPLDPDLDAAGGGYTAADFDQRLTWAIRRPITIQAVHSAGEANIYLMTSREINVDVGGYETKIYQISR